MTAGPVGAGPLGRLCRGLLRGAPGGTALRRADGGAPVRPRPAIRFRPASPQRDLICALARALGGDGEGVCLAYVEAEREGHVARPRGAEDMAPGAHARALWSEGRRAGWFAR